MKYKAELVLPDVMKTPLAECVIDVPKDWDEFKTRLAAAHKLMENFEINIEKIET